jgi:hypothetical protein
VKTNEIVEADELQDSIQQLAATRIAVVVVKVLDGLAA